MGGSGPYARFMEKNEGITLPSVVALPDGPEGAKQYIEVRPSLVLLLPLEPSMTTKKEFAFCNRR